MGKFPGKPSKIVYKKRVNVENRVPADENDFVKAAENIYLGLSIFRDLFGNEEVEDFCGFSPEVAASALRLAELHGGGFKKYKPSELAKSETKVIDARPVYGNYSKLNNKDSLLNNVHKKSDSDRVKLKSKLLKTENCARRKYISVGSDYSTILKKNAAKKLLQKAKRSCNTVQENVNDKGNNIVKKFVLPCRSAHSSRVIKPNKRFIAAEEVLSGVSVAKSGTVKFKKPKLLDLNTPIEANVHSDSGRLLPGNFRNNFCRDGKRKWKPSYKVQTKVDPNCTVTSSDNISYNSSCALKSSPNNIPKKTSVSSGDSVDNALSTKCDIDDKYSQKFDTKSSLKCSTGNGKRVILRKARLNINTVPIGLEGPFSSGSHVSANFQQQSTPGTVECGVCGAVRFYKFVKQARKFGVNTCESCRKFIAKMINCAKDKRKDFPVLVCLGGDGLCNVPAIVRSKHWKNKNHSSLQSRCPACWLKMCLRTFQIPNDLLCNLSQMLPPYLKTENTCHKLYPNSSFSESKRFGDVLSPVRDTAIQDDSKKECKTVISRKNISLSLNRQDIETDEKRVSTNLETELAQTDSSIRRRRRAAIKSLAFLEKHHSKRNKVLLIQKEKSKHKGSKEKKMKQLRTAKLLRKAAKNLNKIKDDHYSGHILKKKNKKSHLKYIKKSLWSFKEDIRRQKLDTKGPRVKHVCRSASIVLGQPVATFPEAISIQKRHFKLQIASKKSAVNTNSDGLQVIKHQDTKSSHSASRNVTEHSSEITSANSSSLVRSDESSIQSHRKAVKSQHTVLPREARTLPQSGIDAVEPVHQISIDFWESYDPEEVCNTGFGLIGSEPFYVKALCFLCGSAGHEKLIHCALCCEPYHSFCVDGFKNGTFYASNQSNTWRYDWICQRCTLCHICGRGHGQQLCCQRCHLSYHLDCLGPEKQRSRVQNPDCPWICSTCLRCKSCSIGEVAVFVGNLPLCNLCFKLRQKGNFCPLCQRCYEDNDFDTKMMECAQCKSWIHAKCEGLSDEHYQILSYLPDFVEFVCRACCVDPPAPWWNAVEEELKAGYLNILKSLSKNRKTCSLIKSSPKKNHLYKHHIEGDECTFERTKCLDSGISSIPDESIYIENTVSQQKLSNIISVINMKSSVEQAVCEDAELKVNEKSSVDLNNSPESVQSLSDRNSVLDQNGSSNTNISDFIVQKEPSGSITHTADIVTSVNQDELLTEKVAPSESVVVSAVLDDCKVKSLLTDLEDKSKVKNSPPYFTDTTCTVENLYPEKEVADILDNKFNAECMSVIDSPLKTLKKKFNIKDCTVRVKNCMTNSSPKSPVLIEIEEHLLAPSPDSAISVRSPKSPHKGITSHLDTPSDSGISSNEEEFKLIDKDIDQQTSDDESSSNQILKNDAEIRIENLLNVSKQVPIDLQDSLLLPVTSINKNLNPLPFDVTYTGINESNKIHLQTEFKDCQNNTVENSSDLGIFSLLPEQSTDTSSPISVKPEMSMDKENSFDENSDCCLEHQVSLNLSPSLLSVKKKVYANHYESLTQFHQEVENFLTDSQCPDILETYHNSMHDIFPWFDLKYGCVQNKSDNVYKSSPTVSPVKQEKDLSSSSSALSPSQKQIQKFTLPIHLENEDNYYYYGFNNEDNRICIFCKGLGDGLPHKEGRMLYCGQNEWSHANCALWSAEVFEEIDGSLQNVQTAVSRGRQIRCRVCNKTGASVGCCFRNCIETYHFQCAINNQCAFMEDKSVFCPIHKDDAEGILLREESDFLLERPIYVELDRKKKKFVKPHKVRFIMGSLLVDSIGEVVENISDYNDVIIPIDLHCSRWYWSVTEPWRVVQYNMRTAVVSTSNTAGDTGDNVTVDHSQEQKDRNKDLNKNLCIEQKLFEKLQNENCETTKPVCTETTSLKKCKTAKLSPISDEKVIKKLIDHMLEVVCRDIDDNCLGDPQNATDLLPPDLKDAIFEDLPCDLLDGISMQDIFPKLLSCEDTKNECNISSDNEFDSEATNHPKSERSEFLTNFELQTDSWLKLQVEMQDCKDIHSETCDKDYMVKEIKTEKPEYRNGHCTRKSQKSCSLAWNCKADGSLKRKKCSKIVPKNSGDGSLLVVVDTCVDRTYKLQELKLSDGVLSSSTSSVTSDIESVKERKQKLEPEIIPEIATGSRRRSSHQKEEGKENKRSRHSRCQFKISQVDGAADSSSGSEGSPHRHQVENGNLYRWPQQRLCYAPRINEGDEEPVTCSRCRRTYRTKVSFERHLPTCSSDYILSTSDSDSENNISGEEDVEKPEVKSNQPTELIPVKNSIQTKTVNSCSSIKDSKLTSEYVNASSETVTLKSRPKNYCRRQIQLNGKHRQMPVSKQKVINDKLPKNNTVISPSASSQSQSVVQNISHSNTQHSAPTIIMQQMPSANMLTTYVDAFQQQSGQNLQLIASVDAHSNGFNKTQFITSASSSLLPAFQMSENYIGLQNGGIPMLSGVPLGTPQPAVLGTIIQPQPTSLQCGVVATEHVVLNSAGGMFLTTQPMYFGLETIVSNAVMPPNQFVSAAVSGVMAGSFSPTTTQVFQSGKMEPIVEVPSSFVIVNPNAPLSDNTVGNSDLLCSPSVSLNIRQPVTVLPSSVQSSAQIQQSPTSSTVTKPNYSTRTVSGNVSTPSYTSSTPPWKTNCTFASNYKMPSSNVTNSSYKTDNKNSTVLSSGLHPSYRTEKFVPSVKHSVSVSSTSNGSSYNSSSITKQSVKIVTLTPTVKAEAKVPNYSSVPVSSAKNLSCSGSKLVNISSNSQILSKAKAVECNVKEESIKNYSPSSDCIKQNPLKVTFQKQTQDGYYKISNNNNLSNSSNSANTKNSNDSNINSYNTTNRNENTVQEAKSYRLVKPSMPSNGEKQDSSNDMLVPVTPSSKNDIHLTSNQSTIDCEDGEVDKEKPLPDDYTPDVIYEVYSQDGFVCRSSSISDVWQKVFNAVQKARIAHNIPPLPRNPFHEAVNSLRVLGLKHNGLKYLIEQLPGVARCVKYKPQYHKFHQPIREDEALPLINPTGCARSECFIRKSQYDMFSWLASRHRKPPKLLPAVDGDITVSNRRATSSNLPMAMRFRHLKETSKEAVGVYRSHIHGRGLFCLRDIEMGEMVIEYAGEVIRSTLTDKREKYYESKNIGCYMFRIDDQLVVDATMRGNAARFINHSCEPNCYSRIVDILGKKHILIFALRRILQGEELTYDYKFPFEDIKIPCTCGSRRCRKYLN